MAISRPDFNSFATTITQNRLLPGSEAPVGWAAPASGLGLQSQEPLGFGSGRNRSRPWVTWEKSSARLQFPWQRQSPANPGLGSTGARPQAGTLNGPGRPSGGGTCCRPGHARGHRASALAPASVAAAAAPECVGTRRPGKAEGGDRGGRLGRGLAGLQGPAGTTEGGRRALQTLLGSLQLPRVA